MLARLRPFALAAPLAIAALTAAPPARAFCGFYVAGADKQLYNNATMVVLMRDGTRTVLSMQNNYQGPPESFAMVVPVPVVLQKENVKTLPGEIFDKVDKLAAPRLVEYWEQDPCRMRELEEEQTKGGPPMPAMAAPAPQGGAMGVKIEAQFKVGEYDIVILSAEDSTGLDKWLRLNGYKIPDGAEPLLRPYVQSGSKFFVAKVDVQKVRFEKGMARLSPLRFHYDSETFNLPVRLGLVNSSGKQDLIVHILARGQRYETANYKNVTIPTNLDVDESARGQFGVFYAALFDRTLEQNPKSVITEYSWDSGNCDPCPGPTLDGNDLATLGMDVLPGATQGGPPPPRPMPGGGPAPMPMPPMMWNGGGFVLTRLHARYGKDTLGEDLVFRAAPPIEGGREFLAENGKLETGAKQGYSNTFQGRYAIRHAWKGAINCANPRRGVWGGPPEGEQNRGVEAAQDLAFAPRGGVKLASFVRHDVPEIGLKAEPASMPAEPHAGSVDNLPPRRGCGACVIGEETGLSAGLAGFAAALGALGAFVVRRRRRH
jgi:hypothetical protein